MENIIYFDVGIEEYHINGVGVLRFNPSDPNVYTRFAEAKDDILAVEKNMSNKANTIAKLDGPQKTLEALRLMTDADRKIKDILNQVYGHGNDFHTILEGVNLLAVGSNGNRIISNLIDALTPIMEQGAKQFADGKIAQAKQNREQRRANQ